MNERIKQLADQMFSMEQFEYAEEFIDHEFMEKFARLIVQECANILDKEQWDKGEDWVCADGTRIIPKIKEHFGVEE